MGLTRRGLGLGLIGGAVSASLLGGVARADDDPYNVFIAPSARPYRAKLDAPYPVVDWFKAADKNADGRLDHAEFRADCEAFFHLLDQNKDGVLDATEVAFYEERIAPEVLGRNVEMSALGGRLWLAQMGGGIDPGANEQQNDAKPPVPDSAPGAEPYSFFNEPEPLAAADVNFNGIITLPNLLKLADQHFAILDKDGRGYLTLATLPKTQAQIQVERWQRRHRHS